jgi:polar amino acid transport system substrate-binding protein
MMTKRVCGAFTRALLTASALAALVSVAGAASLEEIKAQGTIKIVTTASSPPHGFVDPRTSKLSGIMVEVADLIAKDLNTKVEFTEVPFGGLIGTITSGRADLMSAPLFVTPERATVLDFSDPIYGWGEGVVVRDDSKKSFTDLHSLSGNTIGVLTGSVQLKSVQNVPGIKEVRTYPDYVTILAEVRSGRIDGALIDPPSVAYQMKDRGITGVHVVKDFKPEKTFYVALAVMKGNKSLLDAVNASVAKNKANGEIGKILARWGVGDLAAK